MSERELEQAGYTHLPRNLEEALDIFEDSQFMKDALGEHIHSFFLTKKRLEWKKYASFVSQWEVDRYLSNS